MDLISWFLTLKFYWVFNIFFKHLELEPIGKITVYALGTIITMNSVIFCAHLCVCGIPRIDDV